jgi:hypothetical protein
VKTFSRGGSDISGALLARAAGARLYENWTDVPGLLSARLAIRDGLIQDIDVTVMRHEYGGERGGTLSLFYPHIDGMFNPERFTEMEPEFGQTGDSNVVDLVSQAGALASEHRDSVVLVADAANGLVLQKSVRDITNASAGPRDPLSSGSYSILTTTLYRFGGGDRIARKAVSRPVPYRMPL